MALTEEMRRSIEEDREKNALEALELRMDLDLTHPFYCATGMVGSNPSGDDLDKYRWEKGRIINEYAARAERIYVNMFYPVSVPPPQQPDPDNLEAVSEYRERLKKWAEMARLELVTGLVISCPPRRDGQQVGGVGEQQEDDWRPIPWYTSIDDLAFRPDKLRKAARPGRDGKPSRIEGRKVGTRWEYIAQSVAAEWPNMADAISKKLAREASKADQKAEEADKAES